MPMIVSLCPSVTPASVVANWIDSHYCHNVSYTYTPAPCPTALVPQSGISRYLKAPWVCILYHCCSLDLCVCKSQTKLRRYALAITTILKYDWITEQYITGCCHPCSSPGSNNNGQLLYIGTSICMILTRLIHYWQVFPSSWQIKIALTSVNVRWISCFPIFQFPGRTENVRYPPHCIETLRKHHGNSCMKLAVSFSANNHQI